VVNAQAHLNKASSMSREGKYRREIVSLGLMLHQRGYVAATDGNLSVRLDEQRILETPRR
jgi:ribulose-5-phosphate 4-epimerase/fuculose-1-phosphate aldolase